MMNIPLPDPTLMLKALRVIEDIAAHDDTGESSIIYRIAHTAASPNCNKNHPQWLTELESLYKGLEDADK